VSFLWIFTSWVQANDPRKKLYNNTILIYTGENRTSKIIYNTQYTQYNKEEYLPGIVFKDTTEFSNS